MSYIEFEWRGQKLHIDKMLAEALMSLIWNIKHDWDFVVIISGNRMVRVGKSVLGLTVSAFLAYMLEKRGLNKNAFGLDHVIFDHGKLLDIARTKPPYSVFQYDEAREGLVAAKAMTEMQNNMLDFFNECGQLNHIFVLVLPDFFVLREEMAVGRSEFLINVFRKSHVINHDMMGDGVKHPVVSFDRGFFKFYNREAKNLMFDIFRTTRMKSYNKIKPTFPQGQFTDQYPLPKEEYSKLKLEALKRFDERKEEKVAKENKLSARQERANKQRDMLIAEIKKRWGLSDFEIGSMCGVSKDTVLKSRQITANGV